MNGGSCTTFMLLYEQTANFTNKNNKIDYSPTQKHSLLRSLYACKGLSVSNQLESEDEPKGERSFVNRKVSDSSTGAWPSIPFPVPERYEITGTEPAASRCGIAGLRKQPITPPCNPRYGKRGLFSSILCIEICTLHRTVAIENVNSLFSLFSGTSARSKQRLVMRSLQSVSNLNVS